MGLDHYLRLKLKTRMPANDSEIYDYYIKKAEFTRNAQLKYYQDILEDETKPKDEHTYALRKINDMKQEKYPNIFDYVNSFTEFDESSEYIEEQYFRKFYPLQNFIYNTVALGNNNLHVPLGDLNCKEVGVPKYLIEKLNSEVSKFLSITSFPQLYDSNYTILPVISNTINIFNNDPITNTELNDSIPEDNIEDYFRMDASVENECELDRLVTDTVFCDTLRDQAADLLDHKYHLVALTKWITNALNIIENSEEDIRNRLEFAYYEWY